MQRPDHDPSTTIYNNKPPDWDPIQPPPELNSSAKHNEYQQQQAQHSPHYAQHLSHQTPAPNSSKFQHAPQAIGHQYQPKPAYAMGPMMQMHPQQQQSDRAQKRAAAKMGQLNEAQTTNQDHLSSDIHPHFTGYDINCTNLSNSIDINSSL